MQEHLNNEPVFFVRDIDIVDHWFLISIKCYVQKTNTLTITGMKKNLTSVDKPSSCGGKCFFGIMTPSPFISLSFQTKVMAAYLYEVGRLGVSKQ